MFTQDKNDTKTFPKTSFQKLKKKKKKEQTLGRY